MMSMQIFKNDLIFIEIESSDIPWLKIFVNRPVKELSACTSKEKQQIWQALEIIELLMLKYYNCDKVNIASFGNIVPKVHFHIMARFKDDSHFPNTLWGEKLRNNFLDLPSFHDFTNLLVDKLKTTLE